GLHRLVLRGLAPDGELLGLLIKLNAQIGGSPGQQRADHVLRMGRVRAAYFVHGELRLLDDGDDAAAGPTRRRAAVHLPRKFLDLIDAGRRAVAKDDPVNLVARKTQIAVARFEFVGRDSQKLLDVGEKLSGREAVQLNDFEPLVLLEMRGLFDFIDGSLDPAKALA